MAAARGSAAVMGISPGNPRGPDRAAAGEEPPRLVKSRRCPQPFPRGGRPFVPGSRTGCGGTLDILQDYDSAVAALAVLYHVWQRSHILPSRLLHTQPSGLPSPTDPSSWQHNDGAVWYLQSLTPRVSEHLTYGSENPSLQRSCERVVKSQGLPGQFTSLKIFWIGFLYHLR